MRQPVVQKIAAHYGLAAAVILVVLGLSLPFPHTGFIRNALLFIALIITLLGWRKIRSGLSAVGPEFSPEN